MGPAPLAPAQAAAPPPDRRSPLTASRPIPAQPAVDVWRLDLTRAGVPPADRLPAEDRARAARIRGGVARERWLAARWGLREVLAVYLGGSPAEIAIETGESGKPNLAPGQGSLAFNLSHSGDVAVVAVSDGHAVGVDVEWIDGRRDVTRLAPRALGPVEARALRALPRDERPAAFYAAWARREAIAKCHGVGIGRPLPDAPVAVAEIDAGQGLAAAVALAGERKPQPRYFD